MQILQANPLMETERKLFVYFFTNPVKLGQVVGELARRIDALATAEKIDCWNIVQLWYYWTCKLQTASQMHAVLVVWNDSGRDSKAILENDLPCSSKLSYWGIWLLNGSGDSSVFWNAVAREPVVEIEF